MLCSENARKGFTRVVVVGIMYLCCGLRAACSVICDLQDEGSLKESYSGSL